MTEELSGRKVKLLVGGLALLGILVPGLQRFYLGQKYWGIAFLVVGLLFPWSFMPIPLRVLSYLLRLFCLLEGLWVLSQDNAEFDARFNPQHQKLDWTTASKRESQLPEYYLQQALNEGIMTQAEYDQQLRKQREEAES